MQLSKSFPRLADGADRAEIAAEMLRYARLLSARGLVVNTFGNIAIREVDGDRHIIHTKHRGISLEEMGPEHLVAIDLDSNELVAGHVRPSIGYQMHREIFKCRPDVNATIHLHPDDVIAYFAVMPGETMPYVSNDTALVMGKPPYLAPRLLNLELDVATIPSFIQDTNCIVMPGHGITTMGRDLSEAYHRAVSFSAEITRLGKSVVLAASSGRPVAYTAPDEIEHMYEIAETTIYGKRDEN
jgi:L-fuculose-phosphate aldolase